jgi:putative ABC transport system ATP-binding protein
MVTHDAFAASYCKRVLFIKDGKMFTELVKGNSSRKDFFKKVLDVLSVLGGGANDDI